MLNNVRAGNAGSMNDDIRNAYDGTYLSGKGVIVAVIDTGIDILSEEFRKSDGSTRILNIYDQTQQTEYNEEDINAIFKQSYCK